LKDLAGKVHVIAPDHGRSTYGDLERRNQPWQIYSEEDATKGLNCAEDACKITNDFVQAWHAYQQTM